MHRRWVSPLLVFCILFGDASTLLASIRSTLSADPPSSMEVVEPDAALPVDEDAPDNRTPSEQPGRQMLSEPTEECDSDDLSDEPRLATVCGYFHVELSTSFSHSVRLSMATHISTHLRI
jgi:hypothetical protein